ncbi:MAG: hypothetical protein NTV51_15490 [Verrucomicrobia bacterium]|nr:hypothetical protein [Verrucomicrobiota bacterium]
MKMFQLSALMISLSCLAQTAWGGGTVPADVPEVGFKARPVPGTTTQSKPKAINLTITAQGQILANGEAVAEDRLAGYLTKVKERFGALPVHLAADQTQARKRAWVAEVCAKAGLPVQAAGAGK